MTIGNSIVGAGPHRRMLAIGALALSTITISSCQIFSTDVKNPNAMTEDAIATAAAAAGSLVTGLYGAVNASGNQIVGTVGAGHDEWRCWRHEAPREQAGLRVHGEK